MPTNRPFLSNFLAAFRAHSTLTHAKTTSTSTSTSQPSHTTSSSTSSNTGTSTPSNPRTITTKAGPTAALSNLHSPRTGASYTPESPDRNVGSPPVGGRYLNTRARRGSDSSSEGFRDVLGAEKWYIGGRTAGGEEKYFKLGVVRRRRSGGSLSLDRLSL